MFDTFLLGDVGKNDSDAVSCVFEGCRQKSDAEVVVVVIGLVAEFFYDFFSFESVLYVLDHFEMGEQGKRGLVHELADEFFSLKF